jgi:hypothetical protein
MCILKICIWRTHFFFFENVKYYCTSIKPIILSDIIKGHTKDTLNMWQVQDQD